MNQLNYNTAMIQLMGHPQILNVFFKRYGVQSLGESLTDLKTDLMEVINTLMEEQGCSTLGMMWEEAWGVYAQFIQTHQEDIIKAYQKNC